MDHEESSKVQIYFTTEGKPADIKPGISYNIGVDKTSRRRCIIINNEYFCRESGMNDRSGTRQDEQSLTDSLTPLNFSIMPFNNHTASELIAELKRIADENQYYNLDCFMCVILSHGNEGSVYATDREIRIEEIIDIFSVRHSPFMAGIPKIFLIQACRGCSLDKGVYTTNIYYDPKIQFPDDIEGPMSASEAQRLRNLFSKGHFDLEPDFLVAYSTPLGYYSFRSNRDGSYFIQAFCHVVNEAVKNSTIHQLELQHLLVEASRRVAYEFESNCGKSSPFNAKKQMPTFTSTLTKLLYFTANHD